MQTRYLAGWSIEVHYDDDGVEVAGGRWKRSPLTGREYAVFVDKHVPQNLPVPAGFTTREEPGCMLSRKFDPDPTNTNYPLDDWHSQDWDFVQAKMKAILNSRGITKPWNQHSRRKLVGALGNWIKGVRLTGDSIENNLHPVEFLEAEHGYCGGAANALVAMCSILKIPARYIGTWDHAFVEFQDDAGKWLFVENQPDSFIHLSTAAPIPYDPRKHLDRARNWAKKQNHDAVFEGGIIDIIADPARFKLADMADLGWFYNWSCPFVYNAKGETNGADLYVRPQTSHDWIFNLYTGYGGYTGDSIHKRGFFMAERLNSVFELAALYSPRVDDLPYVCALRGGDSNIIFLTPFRDSYYREWDNKTRISSGQENGVRKQFHLSDLVGVQKVVAAIILGPDDKVDHSIPETGGDWSYRINGETFSLASHGGFHPEPNYNGTGMTVHKFEIPPGTLNTFDKSIPSAPTFPAVR